MLENKEEIEKRFKFNSLEAILKPFLKPFSYSVLDGVVDGPTLYSVVKAPPRSLQSLVYIDPCKASADLLENSVVECLQ